jgi:PKHD-type hydroxylase
MRYGDLYRVLEFDEDSIKKINNTISNINLPIKKSLLNDGDSLEKDPTIRISRQAWIEDVSFCKSFFNIGQKINEVCQWNFNIKSIEAIQYGIYGEGGRYDWHVDQQLKPLNGSIRKISMTLFMNDPHEYDGGEFDLELYNPEKKPRYKTFKLKKGNALFFQADRWHRVRPVTSGVRKSLVAWYSGPTFK